MEERHSSSLSGLIEAGAPALWAQRPFLHVLLHLCCVQLRTLPPLSPSLHNYVIKEVEGSMQGTTRASPWLQAIHPQLGQCPSDSRSLGFWLCRIVIILSLLSCPILLPPLVPLPTTQPPPPLVEIIQNNRFSSLSLSAAKSRDSGTPTPQLLRGVSESCGKHEAYAQTHKGCSRSRTITASNIISKRRASRCSCKFLSDSTSIALQGTCGYKQYCF